MPALEIMPQCPTMDEAQRRVSLNGKLPPRSPRPNEDKESVELSPKQHHHHQNSANRIVRFMRRMNHMRGMRRSSNESHREDVPAAPTTSLPSAPPLTGGGSEENSGSFSSIGVKYWPKIREGEEEEAPEAFGPVWSD